MSRASKEARAAYRAKNRDKINAQKRAWRAANLDRVRDGQRRADAKRRDSSARKEWRRQWLDANPGRIKASRKRFQVRHAERLQEWQRAYYAANPEKRSARNARAAERCNGYYAEANRRNQREYLRRHPEVALRQQATQAIAKAAGVAYRLVPVELVEAKMAHLKVGRVVKEARTR